MTRSVFFFFFSLLLLLEVTSAIASARNATSELRYGRCAPGVTVGECITIDEEEEEDGVEAVVRRILQGGNHLSYKGLGRQAVCKGNQYANCIRAVSKKPAPCTLGNRCKHSPGR
ncbi:hypothetical protein AALP_AA1G328800 [Arabis alpina]|uniref:Uncharacterized protein n=1 Tax=Arabis alpina TaxID=50452 RepID=A0A087HS81_ARAAL|nr:hypothetical protein AALP_AA1G328800 [Arabis alpina]